MTDGFDDATAYGAVSGLDDETMGWARYAQSTQHMNLNSGLFYVRANDNTVALMQKLARRLSQQKYWDQTAFNEEIFFLSHGDTSYVPISVRVMDIWQFMNSKVRAIISKTYIAPRYCCLMPSLELISYIRRYFNIPKLPRCQHDRKRLLRSRKCRLLALWQQWQQRFPVLLQLACKQLHNTQQNAMH